jgi:hypothetical protein
MAIIGVARGALLLEPHPAVKHEGGETIARLAAERGGRVEPAPDFRRVDAEQPHAADRRDVDRVAVDDPPHEQRLGSLDASAE